MGLKGKIGGTKEETKEKRNPRRSDVIIENLKTRKTNGDKRKTKAKGEREKI